MTRLSKARQRGLWPEHGPIGYGDDPRVEVTVSMDEQDYDWLAAFVATTGYLWCVEDALGKSVSAIKGDIPMAYHAEGIARQRGVRPAEVMFQPIGEASKAAAANRLYTAALFIAEYARTGMLAFVRDDDLPDEGVLALAQAALGDCCDLSAEIEEARAALDASYAEFPDIAAQPNAEEDEKSGDGGTARGELDDGIPF